MAENNQQDDKKTVVAFIVGLLIGGLLVWAFSGPAADAPTNGSATSTEERNEDDEESGTESDNATSEEGNATSSGGTATVATSAEGSVTIGSVAAGTLVPLTSASYPMSEGWIGVREYQNERLGSLLGVVRFSESQGLVPNVITLQYPTRAGAQYAVVMFSDDGDRQFNLASDVQVDQIFATFTPN